MSIIKELIGIVRSKNKEIEELTKDRDLWKRSENTCNNLYNEQLAEIKKLRDGLEEIVTGHYSSDPVTHAKKILKDGE